MTVFAFAPVNLLWIGVRISSFMYEANNKETPNANNNIMMTNKVDAGCILDTSNKMLLIDIIWL